MSYQERRAAASLISTVMGSTFYFADVLGRYHAGGGAENEFAFWGAAILLYVPAMVVFKVIVQIIFVILNAIVTRSEEPDITDEFDRLVDMKSTTLFSYMFMAGFMLSMAALVAGYAPAAMFVILLMSMLAAGSMLDIAQVVMYRRGL